MLVLFSFAEPPVSPFLPGARDGHTGSLLILFQAVGGFGCELISREHWQLEPVRGFILLLLVSLLADTSVLSPLLCRLHGIRFSLGSALAVFLPIPL